MDYHAGEIQGRCLRFHNVWCGDCILPLAKGWKAHRPASISQPRKAEASARATEGHGLRLCLLLRRRNRSGSGYSFQPRTIEQEASEDRKSLTTALSVCSPLFRSGDAVATTDQKRKEKALRSRSVLPKLFVRLEEPSPATVPADFLLPGLILPLRNEVVFVGKKEKFLFDQSDRNGGQQEAFSAVCRPLAFCASKAPSSPSPFCGTNDRFERRRQSQTTEGETITLLFMLLWRDP